MINAIITNNDISEFRKRVATGNTLTIRDTTVKNKPMISPNNVSPLNPYGANAWLFDGLKEKKKN